MVTATSAQPPETELARQEGTVFLSAAEAILKGSLESDVAVSLICGPRQDPFAGLFRLRGTESVASLLRRHGTRVQAVPDARRAVALAWQTARGGRADVVTIPADQLEQAQIQLRRIGGSPLDGGAMAVILEDRPLEQALPSPREIAVRLDWPVLVPSDVGELRDGIEVALRLSRAGDRPAAVIAHTGLLHMAETLSSRPNRVPTLGDPAAAGRRRRSRVGDSGDVLRVARRLELNRVWNMPSPGERLPVGFIVVGLAAATLRHLVDVLGLVGRVPALELQLVHPLDSVPVGRLLTRCEHVVVLETRPGEIELAVLAVAERLRHGGERPASVWGRVIPPDPDGDEHRLGPDDAIHPSVLVRRIVHLLHSIRPTLKVASRLIPEMQRVDLEVEPRRAQIGSGRSVAALRALVADANGRLEDAAASDEDAPETRLVLEPEVAEPAAGRTVLVEIWDHRPFVEQGVHAVVQASREERPRLIPADRAARVRVDSVNLADRPGLVEELTASATSDGLTILVVRDGPPARYDVATLERSVAEIDRLGFQPRQTIMCPADLACAIRPPADPSFLASRFGRDIEPLHTELSVGRRARVRSARLQMTVQPLLEQIDVLRERPPAWHDHAETGEGVPMPKPRHGRQPQWRAHLAGFRGEAPGPVARVLCCAGSLMGYAVKCVTDAEPIAPGRRA
ncbi:MAG: hypothetical protein ACYTGG_14390, partial [Planctomycetota bacterium]